MKIKKLDLTDINQVLAYEIKEFPNSLYTHKQLKHMITSVDYFCIGVYDANQLIGYAIFNYIGDVWDLLKIFINSQNRNKGYAKTLIHYFVDIKKPNKIMVEVDVTNEAVLFYKKMGFKIINTRIKYYSNGNDAYVMQLLA